MNIYRVEEEHHGVRLDKWLALVMGGDASRSYVKQLIEAGAVRYAGGDASLLPKHKVAYEQEYIVDELPAAPLEILPYDIPLDVLYKDEHIAVINKAVGISVHPGAGDRERTLANALVARYGAGGLSSEGGAERPGIVHRLDKDTSGLLVIARTQTAHRRLSAAMQAREISRKYCAVAFNMPSPASGTIDAPVARSRTDHRKMCISEGGKHAVTHYELQEIYKTERRVVASLLHCALDTGRTHQIRLHMQHIGCPIIGDGVYGMSGNQMRAHCASADADMREAICSFPRQALHAMSLAFDHPMSGEYMEHHAPMPSDMTALLDALPG